MQLQKAGGVSGHRDRGRFGGGDGLSLDDFLVHVGPPDLWTEACDPIAILLVGDPILPPCKMPPIHIELPPNYYAGGGREMRHGSLGPIHR